MEDGTDNHLNGGAIIPEDGHGPYVIIVNTIGGVINLTKCTDTIVQRITLLSKVKFTPLNGLLNHLPNLVDGHGRGGGL